MFTFLPGFHGEDPFMFHFLHLSYILFLFIKKVTKKIKSAIRINQKIY